MSNQASQRIHGEAHNSESIHIFLNSIERFYKLSRLPKLNVPKIGKEICVGTSVLEHTKIGRPAACWVTVFLLRVLMQMYFIFNNCS